MKERTFLAAVAFVLVLVSAIKALEVAYEIGRMDAMLTCVERNQPATTPQEPGQ